ncbi:hypothetical protein K9N68_37150 (plasmid) [Kovacikia minuta CCNUW1]|uniref:hypothetical protein n=1 Tax=Kovacikia minuta TaxID=2931930 RepID=UPI001CC932BA|nr:hypothetical protein [Kovacikia minuta]UBF29840.1 hypothetical protein K9N68_37150 [Kovacikia minuta CCNUW1]
MKRIEIPFPDHEVTQPHSCGHMNKDYLWGSEDLENRIAALSRLPCHTCIEFSRLISGKIAKLYSLSYEQICMHLDKFYPGWKEKILTSQDLNPSFNVDSQKFIEKIQELTKS